MSVDTNIYGYVDDRGGIHRIRLSAGTAAAQATAPPTTGFTDSPVIGHRSSRRSTLQVRGFRLTRRVGTAPNDKAFTTFLPICRLTDYNAGELGGALTVSGTSYIITRKIPEQNTGY